MTNAYSPFGPQPIAPCRGHAFEEGQMNYDNLTVASPALRERPVARPAPANDSFCDRVLGNTANDNRYSKLRAVLDAAYSHAAREKGEERHANGRAFEEQPMLTITRDVGLGFPLGQAMKKAQEAGGMADRGELVAAEKECLGAINYLAGAIIRLREMSEQRMVA